MLGTLINAGAVIIGSIVGLFLNRKLPAKITETVFQGIGVFTIFLGITLAMKTGNYLILIFSIVLGAIMGELLNPEGGIEKLSKKIEERFRSKNGRFSEGLITAFLLFCMGSMTILGAIEEGLGNSPHLLLAKSLLDGFSAIALSAALGLGVMFSVIPLLIYQGGLTLLTRYAGNYFQQDVVNEVTAVGGLLLIAMGLRLMNIKNVRVLNMLPALIFAVVLSVIFL
ncbi:MAG: DUF554 domain-containing protein [Candidatus Cloacimonetes bacterium]|nr:DUF554 domain-containing protein [Candidatus Cloacimonadota bacterium]